ncbi:MAG: hypothetical protein JWM18_2610 [Chloroflexi bacterium]|nr:hypothetical protein [Chloroflexota bacterium]
MNRPHGGSPPECGRWTARRSGLCAVAFIGFVGFGTLTPIGGITPAAARGPAAHDSAPKDHGSWDHPTKDHTDPTKDHTDPTKDRTDPTKDRTDPTKEHTDSAKRTEATPEPTPKAAEPAPPVVTPPAPVSAIPEGCTLFTSGVMVCKTAPPGSKLLSQLTPRQSERIAAALAGANLSRLEIRTIDFNPSPADLANANDPPLVIVPIPVGGHAGSSASNPPPITPGGAMPPSGQQQSGPPTPPILPGSLGRPPSAADIGQQPPSTGNNGSTPPPGSGGTSGAGPSQAAPAPKTGADISASYASLLMIAAGLLVLRVANRRGLRRRLS